MGDPADIGPQYRCEECGVWGPDTTCVRCGAELGEDVRGVPGVYAKKVIAEGEVPAAPAALKFFEGDILACVSSPHFGPITGGTFTINMVLKPGGPEALQKFIDDTFGPHHRPDDRGDK